MYILGIDNEMLHVLTAEFFSLRYEVRINEAIIYIIVEALITYNLHIFKPTE